MLWWHSHSLEHQYSNMTTCILTSWPVTGWRWTSSEMCCHVRTCSLHLDGMSSRTYRQARRHGEHTASETTNSIDTALRERAPITALLCAAVTMRMPYTIAEGYDVQTEHTHAGTVELHLSAQANILLEWLITIMCMMMVYRVTLNKVFVLLFNFYRFEALYAGSTFSSGWR